MRRLSSFTFVSLNFFYKDGDNGINWHVHGSEESQYASNNLKREHALLFGRVTYEMMSGFWPTQQAIDTMPDVAHGMNKSEKYVVSNSLKKADWNNTTVLQGDMIEHVRKLKQQEGSDITILGSGSVVCQLMEHNLIDSYVFMIDPVVLTSGTSLFNKIGNMQQLKLQEAKTFKSGIVTLTYTP